MKKTIVEGTLMRFGRGAMAAGFICETLPWEGA